MIYLDNAATTPMLPQVADRVDTVNRENFGNPSSVHGAGRKASQIVRESREKIARSLGVPASTITFTAGGSESNNLALIGYALAHQDKGKHVITTAIEHPSVLHTLEYLRDRYGFELTLVKPLADGTFPSALIADNLRADTLLVSVMHVNNETGQLLPVVEIGELLRSHQAVFHVDAVQSMGKLPISPNALNCDFLSASGHKFHGPKGVGFLYHRAGLTFDSLIHGGEQEDKRRAGTENIAGIAGMTKALELATENTAQQLQKLTTLKNQLLSELTGIDYYQNTFGESFPGILNLGFPNINHDILLTKLDLAGICVSTGSACTAGTVEPSHVLEAVYGENTPKLKENIRVSLSALTSSDDITQFTQTLRKVL